MLTALRGAIGFLSRIPLGRDRAAWEAFRRRPVTVPVVAYLLGAVLALPLLVPAPAPTVAFLFVATVYLLTGINHVDGVADLADAMVVHGGPEKRRSVMTDTVVGVGAVLGVALVVAGLATAGLALGGLPARALGVVVAAEVGAKLGMATLVCLGRPSHEGMASSVLDPAGPRSLVAASGAGLPAALATWPRPWPALVALSVGAAVSVPALAWSRANLDGVSGDVIGAANEVGRVLALHAGVIAWTQL